MIWPNKKNHLQQIILNNLKINKTNKKLKKKF